MLKNIKELQNESGKWGISLIRKTVFLKDSNFFSPEDLLFIPVPGWEGWKCIDFEKGEPVDHFVRWEFYFHPRNGDVWIFIRIAWPSVSKIVLGFVYPDDRKILEVIALYRCLALVDHSLIGNLPHPLARGIIINDIPVDFPKIFGIDVYCGQHLMQ